jgi:hypothetical protein
MHARTWLDRGDMRNILRLKSNFMADCFFGSSRGSPTGNEGFLVKDEQDGVVPVTPTGGSQQAMQGCMLVMNWP